MNFSTDDTTTIITYIFYSREMTEEIWKKKDKNSYASYNKQQLFQSWQDSNTVILILCIFGVYL